MTLKSLNLLFVSLLLISGASVMAQQAATPPPAPEVPDTPAAFSFIFGGGSFLGVYTEDINKENMSRYGLQREPRGVGITKVAENSPAERAGLRAGDVILSFDNEPVTSVRKLNRLISEVAPEHNARLKISRTGDERDLSVTLGKRSDFNTAFNIPGQRWEDLDKLRDFKFDDKGDKNFTFVFGNNRRIGVTTTQLTKQLADYFGISSGKGLLITSVRDDSPAQKAGLRAGDVITEMDGSAIENVADLMQAINRKEEGEITLTVVRDKSPRNIRLTPERGKDSNVIKPRGLFVAPQAMRIAVPNVNVQLPQIVVPAMPQMKLRAIPQIKTPAIRVNVAPRVLTIPSTPVIPALPSTPL